MNLRSFLLGALATLLLLAAAGVIAVLTGAYDVAATERHSAIGAWALETTFEKSVQRGARDMEAPAFTPANVAAGASHYKPMCAHCHGGVGDSRAEWAEGMRPRPPLLARAAEKWSAAEVFWLVKHGAKLTGMPAFGETHDDSSLWDIAVFVKAMPGMTAEEYAAFPSDHHGEAGSGHSHAAGATAHQH